MPDVLPIVERGDVDAGVGDLAVDVRARRGVFAVPGDGVEGGGQARGRLADGQVMEAAVGALGRAFAGEHADRVFAGAAAGIADAVVGVAAGQVFLVRVGEQLAHRRVRLETRGGGEKRVGSLSN